ncbi:hypothetical protein PARC_b0317 [Pseudoalteromonas arctica A 37-1-2]|uniref:DUF3592 domain-containing protein n=2 Tax=root TaxID=1 RepID=A0A290S8S3_9GAMM|nr:hypothetical protein PARC_b0317 [Pseudoalteromonas arctica A 37-1-2]
MLRMLLVNYKNKNKGGCMALLWLGVLFIIIGTLPFVRWLKCKVSKRHWRVCVVEQITAVANNQITAPEMLHQPTMLVSFRFDGQVHSVLVEYREKMFTRFKQGKTCTLLVDKNNPQQVYNNAILWQSYGLVWLLAGISLCAFSYFSLI